jgi:hypothetical protein
VYAVRDDEWVHYMKGNDYLKDRGPVSPQPSKLQRNNYTDILLVGQVSFSLKYA